MSLTSRGIFTINAISLSYSFTMLSCIKSMPRSGLPCLSASEWSRNGNAYHYTHPSGVQALLGYI